MKDKKLPKIIATVFAILILFLAGFFIWQKQTSAPEVTSDEIVDAEYDAFMEQGKDAFLAEDYQSALEFYTKAKEIKETEAVYVSLFTINKNLGNHDEARINMELALELMPVQARNWIEYADYVRYQFDGTFEEVSAIYEQGIEATIGLVKPHVDMRTSYAAYLEDMKKYDEAIANLEVAKGLDKTRPEVYQQSIDLLKAKKMGIVN